MSVYNLGVVLNVQCEHCKKIRQFTANLRHERVDDEGYLVDQRGVCTALQALGWQCSTGHWFCSATCLEAWEQPR